MRLQMSIDARKKDPMGLLPLARKAAQLRHRLYGYTAGREKVQPMSYRCPHDRNIDEEMYGAMCDAFDGIARALGREACASIPGLSQYAKDGTPASQRVFNR